MADDPEYCMYCRTKPCRLNDKTATHHKPLLVHTEFHRLVTELQEAMQVCFNAKECAADYGDAYAALSQRRKELYEWVSAQTPAPTLLYAVSLKF